MKHSLLELGRHLPRRPSSLPLESLGGEDLQMQTITVFFFFRRLPAHMAGPA